MKLAELNPAWIGLGNFPPPNLKMGVRFDCPCCRSYKLVAHFRQPIDPQSLLANTSWQPPALSWDRTGEDFESLTLLPSIDYSQSGHWHGHIINGEIQ